MIGYRVWIEFPDGTRSVASPVYESRARAEMRADQLNHGLHPESRSRHEVVAQEVPGAYDLFGESWWCDVIVLGDDATLTQIH